MTLEQRARTLAHNLTFNALRRLNGGRPLDIKPDDLNVPAEDLAVILDALTAAVVDAGLRRTDKPASPLTH